MKYIEKEKRPWGIYYVLQDEKDFKLKKIEVTPGQKLSYLYPKKRSETWVILSGIANVIINDISKEFKKGDTVVIPLKAKHRVENKQNIKLIFIEVQTGTYFGEDDIIRIQDDYGRK